VYDRHASELDVDSELLVTMVKDALRPPRGPASHAYSVNAKRLYCSCKASFHMQLRGANDRTVLTRALCISCVSAISYDSGMCSVVFVASHRSFHETLFAEAALARIGGAGPSHSSRYKISLDLMLCNTSTSFIHASFNVPTRNCLLEPHAVA
jgi:hypothetical protein